MSSKPIHYQSISELSQLLAQKQLSAVELMQVFIDRTLATEPQIKAFISFDPHKALLQAKASDERRSRGQVLSLLDGIPVSLKDILAQKDTPLTCGSRMLKDYVSPYDATVVERLQATGAILWGRLNMDEFAMGSSTEHSYFHTTANPWDVSCVPGGSSGGSAAAVSVGSTAVALGSDTGGSIRQPAAFCGVVGLKPSYGRVSRYGVAAFASSLDQIGPLGRTVQDVAIVMQSIAGQDDRDSTSYPIAVPDYLQALQQPTCSAEKKWVLGIPEGYLSKGLDPQIAQAVRKAIEFYQAQGCSLQPVSLPDPQLAIAVYYVVATAEASSNLARYDGIRYTYRSPHAKDLNEVYCKSRAEGFGDEVKRRILLGTYVLSSGYYDAFYLKAQKARAYIRNALTEAFQGVDAILTPTTPTVAFKMGQRTHDPLTMYLSDAYTIAANLAGFPALSLPCGFSTDGLPIGLQIIGKPFKEEELLALGQWFEQAHAFSTQHPQL